MMVFKPMTRKNSALTSALLAAFLFTVYPAQSQAEGKLNAPVLKMEFSEIIAAYTADPVAAAKRFDHKRIAFTGRVIAMGSSPTTTYFGAYTADGHKFDTSFDVEAREALKSKFANKEIVAFKSSNEFLIDCLNEGYLPGAIVPSIKLTHCRVAR